MRCKLLAMETKSLSPSVRASISSWRGQRTPVPSSGACGSQKNIWSPFSAPKSWLEAGPGRALKLEHHLPRQPRCPAGTPGEVVWRMGRAPGLQNQEEDSLLGHSQRGLPTCPAPCAGRSEALSVRAHGLEGVWRPGGLALTEGRAGLRAHPCPQPDTAQGKHGPRGDLELVS